MTTPGVDHLDDHGIKQMSSLYFLKYDILCFDLKHFSAFYKVVARLIQKGNLKKTHYFKRWLNLISHIKSTGGSSWGGFGTSLIVPGLSIHSSAVVLVCCFCSCCLLPNFMHKPSVIMHNIHHTCVCWHVARCLHIKFGIYLLFCIHFQSALREKCFIIYI